MNVQVGLDRKKIWPIATVVMLGISSVLWQNTQIAMIANLKLLLLAFAQNISFSIISRARNRNSNNYHLIAAVCSNGVWFLTFQHLVTNQLTLSMVLPFITGTTLGSLFGAYISGKIEIVLGLTADATKDTKKKKNEGIKYYFENYSLFVALGAIGILSVLLSENTQLVAIILPLAYINHIAMGLSSRAKNRGSHKYLTIATVLSATIWFLTFGFLVRNNMSFALFIPYTVATVFGSITGANVSMKIERFFGFKPDENTKVSTDYKNFSAFVRCWYLLLIVFTGCILFAIYQKTTLFMMVAGILVFGSQSMTYVISSRASNRNNMIYHLCARLVNGTITFLSYKYFVNFKASPDILAPVLMGTTFGNVFGQKVGLSIESKVGAVMDSK